MTVHRARRALDGVGLPAKVILGVALAELSGEFFKVKELDKFVEVAVPFLARRCVHEIEALLKLFLVQAGDDEARQVEGLHLWQSHWLLGVTIFDAVRELVFEHAMQILDELQGLLVSGGQLLKGHFLDASGACDPHVGAVDPSRKFVEFDEAAAVTVNAGEPSLKLRLAEVGLHLGDQCPHLLLVERGRALGVEATRRRGVRRGAGIRLKVALEELVQPIQPGHRHAQPLAQRFLRRLLGGNIGHRDEGVLVVGLVARALLSTLKL
eukprot:CAMPEP_0170412870 /NCGR_PEP_ID=MMETSP0117_2-20130122/31212_1 /TAXON_ID=400756 /ORGANISM="Durinskia baltica, Strain CSIRO CS-38" /LENGTH=266 /DNA_ID=CAMNT_0010670615 /DNA_START=16 /DNA_END=813 /DNA_ORIENTATION=-